MGKFWVKGPGSTLSLFLLAPVAGTLRTNSSNATYTVDSTGGGPDYIIGHNRAGATSYVMPVQGNTSRQLVLRDETGAINTLANNVFLIPNGADKFNGSSGFSLTGTVTTNGTTTITGAGTKFQSELAPGMSIIISNQAGVNYIINTIASDTSLTLTAAFTGASASGLTVKRTSLTFAANYGTLYIDGNGTDWTVKGDGTPTVLTYTASSGGTVAPFIPPQGVASADFTGWGAGGGGGGAQGNSFNVSEGSPVAAGQGGGAGGSAILQAVRGVAITPQSNNAIVIGSGGVGGAGGDGGNGVPGAVGINGGGGTATTCGSLIEFLGASGGLGGGTLASGLAAGGAGYTQSNPSSNTDITKNIYSYIDGVLASGSGITTVSSTELQSGGMSTTSGGVSLPGNMAIASLGTSFAPGGGGHVGLRGSGAQTAITSSGGGGGGSAGPGGSGGNGAGGGGSAAGTTGGTGGAAGSGGNGGTAGGNGNTASGGAAGTAGNATTNSGGGGGGGASGGNSSDGTDRAGSNGANGGDGKLLITYVL